MIKKIKTIQRIKNLKNSRSDDDFLHAFRNDLQRFMAANPVMGKDDERLSVYEKFNLILNNFYKINETKFMPIAIVAALIVMLSGGGAALASQNSVPGETLYPVKTLTENVRSVLAVNKQSEAKLQSKLAAERLEEVNKMLQMDEVDAEGVEIALSKLKEHVARMSQIVEAEKIKGKDVTNLENDLSKNLKTNKEVLERTFKQHKEGLENEKKGLEKEVDIAEKNNSDENTINALKAKLDALKQKRESFENKEHSIKREIKDNDDEDEEEDEEDEEEEERETKSYNTIELKLSALKAMREAEKEKNELSAKASSTNIIIADKYFKQYNDFMAKASSSLAMGGSISTSTATSTDLGAANYKQAYQFAKQAKEMLELAEQEYERQAEVYEKKDERNKEIRKDEDREDEDDEEDEEEDDKNENSRNSNNKDGRNG